MYKVLLFSLFFTTFSFAAPPEKLPCAPEAMTLAREWKARDEWVKHFQKGLSDHFWAAPTHTIGEWVLAKKIPEGTVVSKLSESGRIEVTLTGPKCKKNTKAYPHSAPKPNHVSDKEISSFVKKHKEGAIYVWSPRMTLSENGIAEVEKAAAKMKLPLLVLLDSNLSENEFQKLQKKFGKSAQRVDSIELRMRSVEQHFPALLVFKDSKILSGVKYGFEKSDRFELDLRRMLGRSK